MGERYRHVTDCLCSRVCQFNWCNNEETLVDLFQSFVDQQVALLWTISICGSVLLCGGPKQLKHIRAGDELGFGMPPVYDIRELCLYIPSDESVRPTRIGCYPVYINISAKVTGDIHPKYLALLTTPRT